jgi:ABC-type bacteriocin/lantibiotic exporter with double-glycine peptidase domain
LPINRLLGYHYAKLQPIFIYSYQPFFPLRASSAKTTKDHLITACKGELIVNNSILLTIFVIMEAHSLHFAPSHPVSQVEHSPSGAGHHHHPSPYLRLGHLLWEDKRDLLIILAYTTVAGLLALAVPLATQALVNTIAAGIFIQPLVVLTIIVLAGLLFAGILRLLKLYLVEILQQRIFARVALQLAARIPRIQQTALDNEYAPELINRFFDVLTIQKSMSKILLSGPSATLQILVGLILMAFYSPLLLAFDFVLILFVAFLVTVLGIGGLSSNINESIQKYRVAEWLEEMGRCQTSFKMTAVPTYLLARADQLVSNYIAARRKHFRVLFRQAFSHYLFHAVASAGVLAIGGWLVINRQLTLGQLVASEIIILSVLAALEKLVGLLETFYDLLTGIDKIGHVTDMPLERTDGIPLPTNPLGASIVCRQVYFSYPNNPPILANLDLQLEPGERISLVGESGVGKSTLAALICGLYEPTHGSIEINQMEVRGINLDSLRRVVALVDDTKEVFEGTIEENIVMGREHLTHEHIRWAIQLTQLDKDILKMPQGLKTPLVSEGRNISRGQVQRLLLARAIVDRPQLLILDEAFTGLDERTKIAIIDALYDPQYRWTVIDISHDPEVIRRSQIIYLLSHGQLTEAGSLSQLARNPNSQFAQLFPNLLTREYRVRVTAPLQRQDQQPDQQPKENPNEDENGEMAPTPA